MPSVINAIILIREIFSLKALHRDFTAIMSNLTLTEAFAEYGAKLANPQWAVSAIAKDGALVVSCWRHYITVVGDVWRYEDTLSRWSGNAAGNRLFKEHIEDAFKTNRPIRLVLAITEDTATVDSGQDASKVKKEFSTKPQMVGHITSYDGDRFIIDFQKKRN